MPLILDVSISKKIGQPDFGSLGASCSVQVELPANLVFDDLEAFHRHAKGVYIACNQAVGDELARHQQADGAGASNGHAPAVNGNGQHCANGRTDGNAQANRNGHSRAGGRRATASQARALHAIAGRQGLDLAATLHERYGIERPEDLAITEASEMIDTLKAQANGVGGGR